MSISQVTEMLKLKLSSNPSKTAAALAFEGILKTGQLRSVYWRVFLGLLTLPTEKRETFCDEAWPPILSQNRSLYDKMNEEEQRHNDRKEIEHREARKPKRKGPRFGDESDSSEDDAKMVSDDPLSKAPGSGWGKLFEKKKMLNLIDTDLERLWCDEPFFDSDDVKARLREVLAHSMLDNELGYRQGMHEVLSLVYFVVASDAETAWSKDEPEADEVREATRQLVRTVCCKDHVVHDSFEIFSRMFRDDHGLDLASVYGYVAGSPKQYDMGQKALSRLPDMPDTTSEAALVSHSVQHTLLQSTNPPLWKHLNKMLDIQPSSYGLRWLRLLFLREFTFSQCATLWDGIFAEHFYTRFWKGRPYFFRNGVVPYIALCMLNFISEDLLSRDFSGCLQRLMKYPPVESTVVILHRALEMLHKDDPEFSVIAVSVQRSLGRPHIARSVSPPMGSTPPAAVAPSAVDLSNALKTKQIEVGMTLASVIQRMESKWFPAEDLSAEDKQRIDQDYVMAIAELKQARDVLLGNVIE